MFEIFDELMEETMEEFSENETMEQDDALEGGNAEISPEEAEAVGRGEYSPEARAHAWNEYNRLSGEDRETFLRGHSRNAHIMNMELKNEQAGSTTGEAAEMYEDAEEHFSDYHEQRMLALKNRGMHEHFPWTDWTKAKVRESVGSTTGEADEIDENAEDKESVGYSSDYYEHRMEVALKNGNKTEYDNARSSWAKAKVRESVGSTTGEGEAVPETEEAVGSSPQYWLNKATKDLAEGHIPWMSSGWMHL